MIQYRDTWLVGLKSDINITDTTEYISLMGRLDCFVYVTYSQAEWILAKLEVLHTSYCILHTAYVGYCILPVSLYSYI